MLRSRSIGSRRPLRFLSSLPPVPPVNNLPPATKPAVGKGAKKSRWFRNFVLRATGATVFVYGAGLALAVNNERANEIFSQHIPFGEAILDGYDNYKSGLSPFVGVSDRIGEMLGSKIGRGNEERRTLRSREALWNMNANVQQPSGAISSAGADGKDSAKDISAIPPTGNPSVKQEVASKMEKLQLEPVKVSSWNPLVKDLADALNASITEINSKDIQSPSASVEAIKGAYAIVSAQVEELNKKIDRSLDELLKISTQTAVEDMNQKFEVSMKSQEMELMEKYSKAFDEFRQQLEEKTQQQLHVELSSYEQALLAKHRNELAQVSIKQVEEFNKIIKTKLDSERNGRLAKLDELDKSISTLVPTLDSLENKLVKADCVTQLSLAVKDLQRKLTMKSQGPVDISEDIARLKLLIDILPRQTKKCCSSAPQLIDLTMKQLEHVTDSQKKIVSNEQLYNRWLLLQEELKTTSLLPPNAGFLGHLTAKAFSTLLFTKEGFSTTNDMDSRIARVAENLRLNKLDAALAEVVTMRGWSRKSADEWVSLTRQRLEVLALTDVLDAEIKCL